ncbi:MAG: regulatory protein RecX [Patescibacteria group bacterium]
MPRKQPLDYAFSLLELRDRSTGEIRRKMQQKGYLEVEINAAVERLSELDFLNDRRFAESYLRAQLGIRPRGRFELQAKLRQLYLPEDLIMETLEGYGSEAEEVQAREAARRWLSRKSDLPPPEQREKLARFLAGRGFGWEVIKRTLDQMLSVKDQNGKG